MRFLGVLSEKHVRSATPSYCRKEEETQESPIREQEHDLALPSLPDHLRADANGPSHNDDEKEAKRMRSASTTPRSARATDPDDYDRAMGVTGRSCASDDLDETLEGEDLCHVSDSGAGENLRGIGSASLTERLNRLGAQPNTTIPATCATWDGNVGRSPCTNPGQAIAIRVLSHDLSCLQPGLEWNFLLRRTWSG